MSRCIVNLLRIHTNVRQFELVEITNQESRCKEKRLSYLKKSLVIPSDYRCTRPFQLVIVFCAAFTLSECSIQHMPVKLGQILWLYQGVLFQLKEMFILIDNLTSLFLTSLTL